MWYLLNGTTTMDSTIFSFFAPGRRDLYFQVKKDLNSCCHLFIGRWRYELAKRCRQEEIRINNISIHIVSLGWLHYIVRGIHYYLRNAPFTFLSTTFIFICFLLYFPGLFRPSSLRFSLLFFKLVQLSQIVDPTSVNGEAIAVWQSWHYCSWIPWTFYDLYLIVLLSFDFIFHSIIVLDS